MRGARFLALALCSAAAILAGCDDSTEITLIEGRDYDEMRMVAVHRGRTTRQAVRELFGEPWRVSGPEEAEEWEYYTRFKKMPGRTLGIFPRGKPSTFYKRMLIRFHGDFVDRVDKDSSD